MLFSGICLCEFVADFVAGLFANLCGLWGGVVKTRSKAWKAGQQALCG